MNSGKITAIGKVRDRGRAGYLKDEVTLNERRAIGGSTKWAICYTFDLACILVFSTSFAWIFSSSFKKNCH